MVRWRLCLALVVLLMLPARIGSKSDDEDEEESEGKEEGDSKRLMKDELSRRSEEAEDEEDDDDDEEEEDSERTQSSVEVTTSRRRTTGVMVTPPQALALALSRTTQRKPLECFVCAYKSETPLRACLDPTKFRVHTITCHSVDDKCFTSVIAKGDAFEAVVRGCRTDCVNSPETTCCDLNRCNNQVYAMPLMQLPKAALAESKPSDGSQIKCIPPLFFISVLLLLQTVVKVAIV